MSIYGVTDSQATSYQPSSASNAKKADTKKTENTSDKQESGVVYEPSTSAAGKDADKKVTDYSSTIKQLKSELSNKNRYLQNLVDQLLSKQAKKYNTFASLFEDIKNGKVNVDPTVAAQAQKDVSEDGYWGVEQTSERLVSMAKALSGGDPAQADKMISAIKKGYDQAAKAWGGDLPDICQRTIDAATKKLDEWRGSLSTSTEAAASEEK